MSLNTDSPDAKKPCKGILKSSSSFDKHTTAAATSVHRKSAKFDELNVLQTYHPPDKDYGHMKVDEPKTPYNYVEEGDVDQLDAELLAEKLLDVAADFRLEEEESSEEEEEELSEEQKKRKLEFERRRKAHYNEFEAIKLARKLIEEEQEDEDDDDEGNASKTQEAKSSKGDGESKMEVEDQDEVDRPNGDSASSSQPTAGIDSKEADEI